MTNPGASRLDKNTSGQSWGCIGEEGAAWTWWPWKTSTPALWQQRNSQPEVKMLIPGAALIAEGNWGHGWLWAVPEPISCPAALIHLSPSGSVSSGGWVSNGKEQHIYRSSTGLGAHTGACWEPRLPWEQPRVPLYFPFIFLYRDIHKMSFCLAEGLCHAVFAGSLFKQQNYLLIWFVNFQPLIHHTGTLYEIIYCHKNLGKNC